MVLFLGFTGLLPYGRAFSILSGLANGRVCIFAGGIVGLRLSEFFFMMTSKFG